ncbi:hypothetical protein SAMD00023353_1100440 [Rosellinia necatrix]|uniref:Uncharacterized protein n=1 Tax=Rosellinia necatrix TaxID=77044 RepID=A0A1S8A700_ROSNE|nr:hypothetical protein SAMD00023353_1100440 [Rosellinia necatrix]
MPCSKKKKKPEYYRDKNWEPPRDLAIAQQYPVQYTLPVSSYHPALGYQGYPGYQGYHAHPSYHPPPNCQPVPNYQHMPAGPSHHLPMLPVPAATTPSSMMMVHTSQAPYYHYPYPGHGAFQPRRY